MGEMTKATGQSKLNERPDNPWIKFNAEKIA